jgi:hypothetical protein
VDLGPGVTPAAEPAELLIVVAFPFGFAPLMGLLRASFADAAPLVGPLPASASCTRRGQRIQRRPLFTRPESGA